jgi:hypothetical protein
MIRDGKVDIALPEVNGLVRLNVDCVSAKRKRGLASALKPPGPPQP